MVVYGWKIAMNHMKMFVFRLKILFRLWLKLIIVITIERTMYNWIDPCIEKIHLDVNIVLIMKVYPKPSICSAPTATTQPDRFTDAKARSTSLRVQSYWIFKYEPLKTHHLSAIKVLKFPHVAWINYTWHAVQGWYVLVWR